MVKQYSLRQRVGKAIIAVTFLLFPVIINYFSPYLPLDAGSQGIINGSLLLFGLMVLSSLF